MNNKILLKLTIISLALCSSLKVFADNRLSELLNSSSNNNANTFNINQNDIDKSIVNEQDEDIPKSDEKIKKKKKKKKKKKPITAREEAFKRLLEQTLPLTPKQIIKLKKEQDASQKAVAAPVDAPPKPVSSTLTLDLSTGNTPPIIRLAAGFVTSLVFSDATGQAWPVSNYSLGNPEHFNIKWDSKTNALFVQCTKKYITGNLAVRLANLDSPVMISFVSGQKEVDYRVDLQIRGRGPNALNQVYQEDSIVSAPKQQLLNVLDGIPPKGSKQLIVSNNQGEAWLFNNKVIFRTKLKVLAPAWMASVSSLDGTNVYEIMPTPLILASKNGKTIKIKLRGL